MIALMSVIRCEITLRNKFPFACNSSMTASEVLQGVDLTGKTILTTGGDGNIASHLNLAFAKQNASLILACYNLQKCNTTAGWISKETGMAVDSID